MRRRCLLLVSLTLLVGFAPAPSPRARRLEKDDLSKMQGTWVAVKYAYGGSESAYRKEMTFTFTGSRVACSVGGRPHSAWDFGLSLASSPRAITKTRDDKRSVRRGIYRFEGDRLIIYEGEDRERPEAFDSRGTYFLIELERR